MESLTVTPISEVLRMSNMANSKVEVMGKMVSGLLYPLVVAEVRLLTHIVDMSAQYFISIPVTQLICI